MIYFDNAATSFLKPQSVRDAVAKSFDYVGNASRGVNTLSMQSERLFLETRFLLADLFGTGVKQIAFTHNATDSLNTVLKGFIKPEDHVITTVMEHNSVLRPLYQIGCELSLLSIDQKGELETGEIDGLVHKNTKAMVLTHAANLTGVSNHLKQWGDWCEKHQIAFIVDASQSAGVLEINMEEMKIDALCFTGHKSLFGPQGTGGIAVRKDFDIEPLKVGGSGIQTFSKEHPRAMPTRLEAGTLNGHGIAGLKAGLEFIKERTREAIHEKEIKLYQAFLEGVSVIPGITMYGVSNHKTAVLSLNVGNLESGVVSEKLLEHDIIIRSGGHCAPLHHEAFGTVEQGMVRFSFSYFNTLEEVDKALTALQYIYKES